MNDIGAFARYPNRIRRNGYPVGIQLRDWEGGKIRKS